MIRAVLTRWRELALAVALVVCYLLGRRAQHQASAAAAWRDSTAVARRHSDSALAALRQQLAASDATRPDLDSARAAWLALRPADATRCTVCENSHNRKLSPPAPAARPDPALTTLDAAIAHAAAVTDAELGPAGDHLERACTAYESACERAKRAAAAALAAKDTLIALLEHPPPDPAAARFQPRLGGGYDPFNRWPLLSADAALRVAGAWYLTGELTQPIAPHAEIRGAVRLMWRF